MDSYMFFFIKLAFCDVTYTCFPSQDLLVDPIQLLCDYQYRQLAMRATIEIRAFWGLYESKVLEKEERIFTQE